MENIDENTIQKSPEMSHLKERKGRLGQLSELETSALCETRISNGFQRKDIRIFSAVNDKKTHKRQRRGPDYRRIHKYFKSTKQYWKERNRRKEVYQLHCKGLTYPQIAAKLGVSAKTVQRDMAKVAPYWHRKMINEWRKVEQERRVEFHRNISGLSLRQQWKYLHRETERLLKMWKAHDYVKKTLTFTINLDEILNSLDGQCYGRPFITFSPKTMNCRLSDLRLKFRFKKGDQIIPYSTLTFT